MKSLRVIVPIVLSGAAACGTEATGPDVTLEAPAPTEARISISAALEVSDLFDEGLADRVVIEDITVNLAEVRLLAADPRIPPGGYSLLSMATLLEFYGAEDSKLDLTFPEVFLAQEDLAVYLRIMPSEALQNASIVISGRYYSNPIAGGQSSLKASDETKGASDPDGDPVMPNERPNAHDEPRDDLTCASDPDGDPVMCGRRYLVGSGEREDSIAFELRTSDVADLVATLGTESALNVVVGIPASQWFTEEVVASLDRALVKESDDITESNEKVMGREEVIIVESAQRATRDRVKGGRGDYFVTNREIDELTVRR